jgi:cell division protein ZapA
MVERRTISVQIFGKSYPLRGDADQEYTQKLAQFVEEQMQKVAEQSSAVDTQKIAVLAALNIANELFLEREKEAEMNNRTDALLRILEATG